MVNRYISELRAAPDVDRMSEAAVTQRAAHLLRPTGALARLDEIASWLAGWQRSDCPEVSRPGLLLAAADHGVTVHGVSAYPADMTRAMVDAMRSGVATSVVLAESLGAVVRLVDAGVGEPTADITQSDAMSSERFDHAFSIGRASVASLDVDLLLLGEMGIGNTTAAAAVAAAMFGGDVIDWVGDGTGIGDEARARKIAAVESAVDRVAGETEPLEVLRRVGGAELVALAGATLEARLRSIPVILDGYATAAAVAPLEVAVAGALDHTFAAHLSPEPGHRLLLERIGKSPLLDLGMRLGEGSGALVALPIVRAAALAVTDVATFEEWGL